MLNVTKSELSAVNNLEIENLKSKTATFNLPNTKIFLPILNIKNGEFILPFYVIKNTYINLKIIINNVQNESSKISVIFNNSKIATFKNLTSGMHTETLRLFCQNQDGELKFMCNDNTNFSIEIFGELKTKCYSSFNITKLNNLPLVIYNYNNALFLKNFDSETELTESYVLGENTSVYDNNILTYGNYYKIENDTLTYNNFCIVYKDNTSVRFKVNNSNIISMFATTSNIVGYAPVKLNTSNAMFLYFEQNRMKYYIIESGNSQATSTKGIFNFNSLSCKPKKFIPVFVEQPHSNMAVFAFVNHNNELFIASVNINNLGEDVTLNPILIDKGNSFSITQKNNILTIFISKQNYVKKYIFNITSNSKTSQEVFENMTFGCNCNSKNYVVGHNCISEI